MKIVLTFLLLMLPVAATAENQAMNAQSIEKMMQLMQEVEQCMEKVDQSAMDEFEKAGEEMSNEIEELCNKGKRKKAQKKAIAFGKKAMKNTAILQMQKCGEITKGLIPGQSDFSFEDEFDYSDKHVCDE